MNARKPLLALIASTAILGMMPTAQAFEFNPAIGVDGAYAFYNYDKDFGKPIYKADDGAVIPYIGLPIWNMIGLEAGYQWLPKRNKSIRLGAGERGTSGAITPIPANNYLDVQSHWEMKAPYLGVTFNMPWPNCKRVSVFGMLGAAYVNLKADEVTVGTQAGALTTAQRDATLKTFEQNKGVMIAKLGASLMLTDYIGIRGFGSWMNTSQFDVHSNQVTASTGLRSEIRPKDTWMLGGGIFVTNFM